MLLTINTNIYVFPTQNGCQCTDRKLICIVNIIINIR